MIISQHLRGKLGRPLSCGRHVIQVHVTGHQLRFFPADLISTLSLKLWQQNY